MKQLLQQIQEQVKKIAVTFEQMCPQWSNNRGIARFSANGFTGTDGKHYNITIPQRCVVGEAWGRNSDYAYVWTGRKCQVCHDFGFTFTKRGLTEENTNSFADHMNAAHQDILQERGLK